MKVNIEVRGQDKVLRFLQKVSQSTKGFSPELKTTGEFLRNFYATIPFETEGSIWGKRWQELSPRYKTWKMKHYPGRGILERTGNMRRSFEFVNTSTFLRVYNTADYFKYHQAPSQAGSKMPRRLVMALNKKLAESIVGIVRNSLFRRIR